MAQVVWSPSSLADLDSIAEYIARDSIGYANLFVQNVIARVETMGVFPKSGRVVPEYEQEDVREFLFGNYRIVYRVRGGGIQVAAVVHGARLLPDTPP